MCEREALEAFFKLQKSQNKWLKMQHEKKSAKKEKTNKHQAPKNTICDQKL